MSNILYWCTVEKNLQNLNLSNYIVKILVLKEKHWLLGTLIIILIQGVGHDKVSLDPNLYKYQDMLRPLKLTRFSTNATVESMNLMWFSFSYYQC